jgi:hypothetical protein
MDKKKRQLKVTEKIIERRLENTHVPTIQLSGKWLKEAGFHAGEIITITIIEEGILIEKSGTEE